MYTLFEIIYFEIILLGWICAVHHRMLHTRRARGVDCLLALLSIKMGHPRPLQVCTQGPGGWGRKHLWKLQKIAGNQGVNAIAWLKRDNDTFICLSPVYQGPRWVGIMKEKNAKKFRDTVTLMNYEPWWYDCPGGCDGLQEVLRQSAPGYGLLNYILKQKITNIKIMKQKNLHNQI